MKDFNAIVDFYQRRFAYSEDYRAGGGPAPQLKLSIVIPCYDEDPAETLHSLAKNEIGAGEAEVLLVFNHSGKAPKRVKELHQRQVTQYQEERLANGITVFAIAAFDLPQKHAGVGLARKVGMDVALRRFAAVGHDGLIVCLDADSKVSTNYTRELLKAEGAKANGLSIYFEHHLDALGAEERQRIGRYEVWLRYYVQALRFAGYLHAFHTIGSSMAVRASAYAKIGGMNRRKAGEDFYFLHKLIPQGRFYDLTRCSVYPSARISDRVPFGTGRAMLEMQQGSKDFLEVYHHCIFTDLKEWLQEAPEHVESRDQPVNIHKSIDALGWKPELEALAKRSGSRDRLRRNFFHWLDGFRVLKLVHYLRDHYYGVEPAKEATAALFSESPDDEPALLEYYRSTDKQSPHGPPFAPKI